MLTCKNCSYFWKEDDEAYPCCHFCDSLFPAPCEEEDYYEEPDDFADSIAAFYDDEDHYVG